MRKIVLLSAAGAAVCAGLLALPANAQTVAPQAVHTIAAHVGLRAAGINADVAKAHGYAVLTLADGTEFSIKQSTLAGLGSAPSSAALLGHASAIIPAANTAGSVRPYNTVYGDCGDSYYYLTIYSDGTWSSITGYDVRDAVASKQWHTYLQDPSGSQIEGQEYDNGPTGPSWEGTDGSYPQLSTPGQYLGGVDSGSVVLVDGTSCVSGDPADVSTL
jgi:hypothetical protein